MALPAAEPGMVVRYDYLWHRRRAAGIEAADKHRPVCLVLVTRRANDETRIVLLPITHSPPAGDDVGIEIPAKVKQHLGLDWERSWVIVSEANLDVWPSPDLQLVPGSRRFDYGHLPPRLFRMIRDAFVEVSRSRRLRVVDRDTAPP